MTKSEAVEHLKNSTVKIDNASRTGTGFFIADKLIATCCHNIKGHAKDELNIYWQGEVYAVKSIEINEDDDLALLEIKIDKKHPILQIDESVEVGDECQSFGYSRENGDVITFEYEGKDGDGRLKFKEGLFQSGLSGGAILNFSTHKICGIVKSKRDNTESVALGGRAIPISKLSKFVKSKNYDIDDNGSIFSTEMFKNWVWTSSVESADKLQFSVLALVETLVAVGVSFFVWIYYGFYWHIVTGLVVAPAFLLQTQKSRKKGLEYIKIITPDFAVFSMVIMFIIILYGYWSDSLKFIEDYVIQHELQYYIFVGYMTLLTSIVYIYDWFNGKIPYKRRIKRPLLEKAYIPLDRGVGQIIHLLLVPCGFYIFYYYMGYIAMIEVISVLLFSIILISCIRMIATIATVSFESIKQIPFNWYKSILCIDSFSEPEVVPGIENTNHWYRYSEFTNWKALRASEGNELLNKSLTFRIRNIFIRSLFFLPSVIFRYSLKSTAWIYLPLIWLIQPQDKQDLSTRLKIESKNFIAYLMFFYSLVVVFVFTLLPLIFPHTQLGVYFQTLDIPPTLKSIFFAYEFNLWHLTRFLSALITIVFMISFTKILIMREVNPSYGNFWGAKLLSLRTVRSVLTLVTLGFTAYHILGFLPDGFFVGLWENLKFK